MKKHTSFIPYLSAVLVAFCCSLAHAELNTHAESKLKAPNGGEIKQTRDGFIEVVNSPSSIKIYLYDKNLKAEKKLKDFAIIAEVQRATSKEHENLDLKPVPGGFAANFDSTETPKYYLDIGVANRRSGSADRMSFDIDRRDSEPASTL